MSAFGKIFVYDKDAVHLKESLDSLESHGFITFGTDNIYKLLRYAEKVFPDVVIMNLSDDFRADDQTLRRIREGLCRVRCPQVYTNASDHFPKTSTFHPYVFPKEGISEAEITDILEHMSQTVSESRQLI